MRFLDTLTSVFINVFGITQPTAKKRRQVSWFILGMLSVVALGLAFLASLLMHIL